MTVVTLEISGLLGGHTGADIHLGRLNALMAVARTASIAATEWAWLIESILLICLCKQ